MAADPDGDDEETNPEGDQPQPASDGRQREGGSDDERPQERGTGERQQRREEMQQGGESDELQHGAATDEGQREPTSDEKPDGERDEAREWRFSLEDLDAREEGGNVAGDLARDQPLEPGEINRENALFVVLGVLLVVVFIAAVLLGF